MWSFQNRSFNGVQTVKSLTMTLFLSGYLLATTGLQVIHKIFHEHAASVTHNFTDEQDLCHRVIYHHDQVANCGHASHVIVHEKCALCDVWFHTEAYTIFPTASGKVTAGGEAAERIVLSLVASAGHHLPSRAPPC